MAGIAGGRADVRGRRVLSDPIVLIVLFCLLVSLAFLVFPGIDVTVSGLFYKPPGGFVGPAVPALRVLRKAGDLAVTVVVLVLIVSFILKIALPARRSLVPPQAALFLLTALILGPGLLVNLILKDHWGRPRPGDVIAFGGDLPYVAVWRISNYCLKNCSFVAGEASTAIWLTALAFVVPARYRWPVLALTGAFAIVLSVNRIAFGGHFLSDVLLSWGLTALVMAILYRLIFVAPPVWLTNDRMEAVLAGFGKALRRPFAATGNDKD